ncbi:MAG: aerobic carbon-monoxide dehydrogenase large subunit [Burkholderiales bacterium]
MAVDPATGRVEVLDYVAVEDVARALNPMIVHGQVVGAIVQGLGSVFLVHVVYDDQAQMLNASLADYLVPTANAVAAALGVSVTELPLSPPRLWALAQSTPVRGASK